MAGVFATPRTRTDRGPDRCEMITQVNVAILEASQGQNKILADQIELKICAQGMTCVRWDLVALDLPLFSIAAERAGRPESSLKALAKSLSFAHGLVVVSPEYNGGVPPSLVNTIAWLSRYDLKGGWRTCFQNKPTLMASASGGAATRLLGSLRIQLSYLGAHVVSREISTQISKDLTHDIHMAVDQLGQLCGVLRGSLR